jgi:hypothetical protein
MVCKQKYSENVLQTYIQVLAVYFSIIPGGAYIFASIN